MGNSSKKDEKVLVKSNIYFDRFGKPQRKPKNISSFWRPSVYGAVFQGEKILMVKPSYVNVWVLPGGGAEEDENTISCLKREFFEETGYCPKVNQNDLVYFSENNFYESKGNFFKCFIFIYRVKIKTRKNINLSEIIDQGEIKDIQWLELSDLNPKNCHYIFWPYIKKIKKDYGRIKIATPSKKLPGQRS